MRSTGQRTLNPRVRNSSLTAWPTVLYLLITSSLASSATTFRTDTPDRVPGLRHTPTITHLRSAANLKPHTAARRLRPWLVRGRGLPSVAVRGNRRLHRPH